jgi:hypothetical protein
MITLLLNVTIGSVVIQISFALMLLMNLGLTLSAESKAGKTAMEKQLTAQRKPAMFNLCHFPCKQKAQSQ